MEHNPGISLPGNNKAFLLSVSVLSILTAAVLGLFGFYGNAVVAVIGIPAAFLFALNFEAALISFVLSFFADLHMSYFVPSEFLGVLIVLSFFFTHKFDSTDAKNPLTVPLMVFLVLVIPSFIACEKILLTIGLSFRLVVFASMVIYVSLAFMQYSMIGKILKVYVAMNVINAVHASYTGLTTGARVYGFAGVMFVDYVSIALVIVFIYLIYSHEHKGLYLTLSLILLAGLIFTQTRNTWISCGTTLLLIFLQFMKRSADFGYSRKKIIAISVLLAVSAAAIIALAVYLNPGIFNRLSTAGISLDYEEETAKVRSMGSIATRFFIWMTAWNAFTANPVIGVGLYNFPFVSSLYTKLDPAIYKMFVKGLSPHVTYLAILTETGLIGMMGFLYFLYNSVKMSRKAFLAADTHDKFFFSNLFFWVQIYILFSMLMSDAWLWGHGLMLWGLFLSMAAANYKIVTAKN